MRFIEGNEIEEWLRERGIDLTSRGHLHLAGAVVVLRRFFGQAVTPRGQEDVVASACVDSLGEWDECFLWVQEWGVWPSSEDWPAYYAARGEQGERRSLEVAPGHLFDASEGESLRRFVRLVLENAWDAQLVALLRGRVVSGGRLSHDEWVEISAAAPVA